MSPFLRNSMRILLMALMLIAVFVFVRSRPPSDASGTSNANKRSSQGPRASDQIDDSMADEDRTGVQPQSPHQDPSPPVQHLPGRTPQAAQHTNGSPSETPNAPLIQRVISEKWVGSKAVQGEPARQRIRIVETNFKYPFLRLEEDVTTDKSSGKELVKIRRSSVADHLLVGAKHGVEIAGLRRALVENGYEVRSVEGDSFLLVEVPQFAASEDQDKAATHLLQLDEFIDFAEPDWIVHTAVTPNDPAFSNGKAWSYDNPGTITGTIYDADIDGPDGWDLRNDASSVVVAVTDTGIRYTHEDLAPNMWTDGSGPFGFDAYDQDYDPMDTTGHGTHVAGIIGARGNNALGTAGVAWKVKLMALRFIGPTGGTTSDAIRVINYARMNGAHIINASWGGGGFSQGLLNAINACLGEDIAIVAAAGNFTRNNDVIPHYPSGYEPPNIISVASSDGSDNVSFFSNYGRSFVDLVAPGTDIWSCGIASDSDYQHLSGTSMATPHVTGALALAKVRYPGENMEDLITRLYTSVDTRPSLDGKVATGGRLNLYRLLADSSPSYLHDDFERPYWFYGCYGYWCYSNARMTREADEDVFSPDTGQRSMWFRWTAPGDGLVRFKGSASIADVSVVAFEGVDRYSLKRIADNFRQRPTKASYLYFYAQAGKTYTFSVDSRQNIAQIMVGELVHHPVNDMWRDALNLGGVNRFEAFGETCGATAEPWENFAPHAGGGSGRSIWWKWTPTFSGPFTISTQSSAIDTVLAVYTGSPPNEHVEIASNDDRNAVDWTSEVTFNAVAGTTYHIAVDGYRGAATGDIVLNGYVPGSLFILKHPENKLVRIGDPATLTVAAAGQGLRYQWELDGQPIPGAVQPHYNILRVVAEDFGGYRVRVSDIADTIVSNEATLGEMQISPQILWQTRSRSVALGSNVDLKVRATGTPPLLYQWFKDSVAMPGKTTDQLTLTNVTGADAANYTVTVSNSTGFTTTDVIDLKVFTSPWNGWNYIDPTAQSGKVWSIVHEGGKWVATSLAHNSKAVRISVSDDGKNWNHNYINPEGSVTDLYAPMIITKGNGFWLMACDTGGSPSDVVYKSTDLVNWTQHILPIPITDSVSTGSKLIFLNGYFYLSLSNAIYRTSDGINWTQQQTTIGEKIRGGTMTNGTNLVVVRGEKSYVLTNVAGPWQEIDIDPATTNTVQSSYFHNGRFYVYLSTTRFESTDGLTWAQSASTPNPDIIKDASWVLTAGSNTFAYWTNGARVYASTNGGLTWNQHVNMTPEAMSVAASDGSRIVFGTDLGNLIATDNLFTEIFPTRRFNDPLVGIGYEGGYLIAQYSRTTMVSQCGERWSAYLNRDLGSATEAGPFASVPKKIGGEFWQVGSTGYNSPMISYYRGKIPGMVRLQGVAGYPADVLDDFCEGPLGILAIKITMQQSNGSMVVSSDQGASWSTVTVPGGGVSKYAEIKYLGGHYFYKAYFGNTYASSDLVNWTDLGVSTQEVFHAGKYWLFNGNTVRNSTNLASWSTPATMAVSSIGKVVSFNGALVALQNAFVAYSYDGINWVHMNIGFTASDIAASPDVLLAAGTLGQLAYAGSVPKTSPTVDIIEPVENSSYLAGSVVPVQVHAYSPDQSGDPVVRIYYDGVLQSQTTTPPYGFELPAGAVGTHCIHVECQNGTGPISLARKVITVTDPPAVNQYMGYNGVTSLPGSTVLRNGVFISRSTRAVATSVDGLNWSQADIPTTAGYPALYVAGNDRVLAYSNGPLDKNAAVSLDGVNWMAVELPAAPSWEINYSHGYFWAVTYNTPQGIMTSPDGINWKHRKHTVQPDSMRETVGDPFGTILGRTYSSELWRSTDGGRSWTKLTQYTFVTTLSYDGERFFINEGNGSLRRAGSSADGINWVWSGQNTRNYAVIMVNGTAFTYDTTGKAYTLSYDGITWQAVNNEPLGATITWGEDGYFYAKGPNPTAGGHALVRSHNGIDWDVRAAWPTTETVSLTSSPEGLFASTAGGGLWYFSYGSSGWTQLFATAPAEPRFIDFAKNESVLIASNNGDTLMRSVDNGRTWSTIYDPGLAQYNAQNHTTILQLGGTWLSWSPGTHLLRSVDGMVFTDVTVATGSNTFKAIAHNATHFVAILADGSLKSSLNGLNWTVLAPAGSFPDDSALKLVPDGSGWRALSVDSTANSVLMLSSSADGVSWTQTQVPGSHFSGAPVLETTSSGIIAGRSTYSFSANGTSWVNASVDFSVRSFSDAFYKLQTGWLERSVNGVNWTKVRYFGTKFTRSKVVDGRLHLFGDASFATFNQQDLSIGHVRATTSSYGVGSNLTIVFELTNEGAEPTSAGNVETVVFLTADGFHGNADDQMLGTAIVAAPALQPGGSATLQVQARIPNLIRPGQYRAGIWYNRQGLRQETNASNNFAISLLQPVGIPGWLLRTSSVGNGVIAQDAGQRLFASGSRVSLTANSGKGAWFSGWSGDAVGPESQVTILMNQDRDVQANFVSQVGLQIHIRGAGQVTGAGELGMFPAGGTASLRAVASPGWVFSGWSGAATGNLIDTSVLMDQPKAVTASFVMPIESWKALHFNAPEFLDPLISGNDVDSDADGLENWREYLHGSNPRDPNSRGILQTKTEGGFLSVVFTRLAGVDSGYGLTSEASRNLQNWDLPDLQERILHTANGMETVEARITLVGQQSGFIRFKHRR